MIHQHELKANDVHAYTLETLREHLNIKADGYICKTEMLLNVLIKASAENSSLEAACADLEEVAEVIPYANISTRLCRSKNCVSRKNK